MNETLTVAQLTQAIKQQLELRFPAISVKGEISNLKEQSSGHLYFTLKDAEAQISAVLFKGNTRNTTRLPKNGDQIVVKGEINVYPPRGYYQIIVREFTYLGVGELLLKLHEMKLKIQERGWFNKARKKPLPKYPKTIGVVTSPTGSVIQDILHILSRRLSGFHLILNPVKVQGEGAAEEIARAIEQFNRYKLADVLIVGRGGGSLEDLWAFNEEKVASAIFHSEIPIICAVGHETDFCIADFVADVRAPTPSAAAEIITTEKAHQLQFLANAKNRMKSVTLTQLQHVKKQLTNYKRHPYLSSPYVFLAPHLQRVDDLCADLQTAALRHIEDKRLKVRSLEKQISVLNPNNQICLSRDKLLTCHRSLLALLKGQIHSKKQFTESSSWRRHIDQSMTKIIHANKEKLNQLLAHLRGIDPRTLLTKGFCILFNEADEAVVRSAKELQPSQKVNLLFHDGKAELSVEKIL